MRSGKAALGFEAVASLRPNGGRLKVRSAHTKGDAGARVLSCESAIASAPMFAVVRAATVLPAPWWPVLFVILLNHDWVR